MARHQLLTKSVVLHLVFLLSLGASSCQLRTSPEDQVKQILGNRHLIVSGHSIADQSFNEVRSIRSRQALFQPDGSILHVFTMALELRDKTGRFIWGRNIPNSHGVERCCGGKALALMTSEEIKYHGKVVRSDGFEIIEIGTGRTLAKWRLAEHIKELEAFLGVKKLPLEPSYWLDAEELAKPDAQQEISHANSFFEIQDNEAAKKNPAFAKGNFLYNLHLPTNRFIVLSADLKKILWISRRQYWAHDVQIVNDGRILFFENRQESNPTASRIREITADEKDVWAFQPKLEPQFYSELDGSIRELGDGYYLAAEGDPNQRITIFHRDGRIIAAEKNYRGARLGFKIQTATPADITEFLRHSMF